MNRIAKLTKLILPLLLGPLLVWSVLSVLAANRTVPLKGQFSGTGNDFSGQVTQLGRFDGIFNPQTFSAVWVAANGDTLINQTTSFAFVDADCPDVANWCEYVLELAIAGGTGRFAFSQGQASVTGFMDPAPGGAYNGRIDGLLTQQVPDDADLAARISAHRHPLDVDGDGEDELFEFDVAVDGENDGTAMGSVQWRSSNLVTNFAITDGDLFCDREYDRPAIRMRSTATTWATGNNDAGQDGQHGVAALTVSPISPESGFNYDLRWTIFFTDPELTASAANIYVIEPTFVTTSPDAIYAVINIDPCLSVPGPD
ncbi:MAG: hypothetical protein ACK2U5_18330 [Candidatus Promineifilaceae bacterium]